MLQEIIKDVRQVQASLERISTRESAVSYGTSFPTTGLYAGLTFTRTDRLITYVWNGSQWLSASLYTLPLNGDPTTTYINGVSVTTDNLLEGGRPDSASSAIYIDRVEASFLVQTTFNASNFWNLELYNKTPSNTTGLIGSVSCWQTGRAVNNWYPAVITVGANSTPSQAQGYVLKAVTSGAPGKLFLFPNATLWYRLVG